MEVHITGEDIFIRFEYFLGNLKKNKIYLIYYKKGVQAMSGIRMTRTIETIFHSFKMYNTKSEQIYVGSAPLGLEESMLQIFSGFLRPRLSEYEFLKVRKLVRDDVDELKNDFSRFSLEMINFIAFHGIGPGRSIYCPEYNINNILPDMLADFILERTIPCNLTVVSETSDYESVFAATQRAFSEYKTPSFFQSDDSLILNSNFYKGGVLYESTSRNSIYIEAYPCLGASPKHLFLFRILRQLIGGFTKGEAYYLFQGSGFLGKYLKNSEIEKFNAFMLQNGTNQSLIAIQVIGSSSCYDFAKIVRGVFLSLKNTTEKEFSNARTQVLTNIYLVNGVDRLNVVERVFPFIQYEIEDFDDADYESFLAYIDNLFNYVPSIYANGNLDGMPSSDVIQFSLT